MLPCLTTNQRFARATQRFLMTRAAEKEHFGQTSLALPENQGVRVHVMLSHKFKAGGMQ